PCPLLEEQAARRPGHPTVGGQRDGAPGAPPERQDLPRPDAPGTRFVHDDQKHRPTTPADATVSLASAASQRLLQASPACPCGASGLKTVGIASLPADGEAHGARPRSGISLRSHALALWP